VQIEIHAGDGQTLALLHEFGRVVRIEYEGEVAHVEAELPESIAERVKAHY
jgi:hypothetical protein